MNGPERDVKTAYRGVFATPDGRRVLEDLAGFADLTNAGYADAPAIDPLALAVQEGKRRVVLRIFAMMEDDLLNAVMAMARTGRDRQHRAELRPEGGDDVG